MDSTLLTILVFLAGAALGGAIGWFIANGQVKAAGAVADSLRSQLDGVVEERDVAKREVDAKRSEVAALNVEKARLEQDAGNFDKRLKELREAREEMLAQFKATGADVLKQNREDFLKAADERFGHAKETSEAKIKELLQPVGDRLKKYEEQVGTLEKQRADAFSRLYEQIDVMGRRQEEVRKEAQRLGNSLTNAPKARGRWGERALQNVLEQCGLSQHTDFNLEQSIDTEEGRLRPDAIVNVPGQKKLVIDAKVSLNAYQEAFEADDDDVRKTALGAHAKSMRNHVQQLGAKSYQSQFDDAPDYVVMFVPGEHFVAAALEADPDLWDFAFQNGVLLATPTNLVAIARTIAQVWRQDQLADEAREIGKAGAELYERLAVASLHLKRVGSGLETAVGNYNKFVGSFERNVLSSGKRLADKGIEIGKREIEEVPLVENAPRYTAADVEADEQAALADKSKAAK